MFKDINNYKPVRLVETENYSPGDWESPGEFFQTLPLTTPNGVSISYRNAFDTLWQVFTTVKLTVEIMRWNLNQLIYL